MSKTSLVARQCRLRECASMIRECNNRPAEMTGNEWCSSHSITKANYYYRLKQVRKACLASTPEKVVEQAMVPVPVELMAADAMAVPPRKQTAKSSLKLKVKDVTLCVTDQTSSDLLAKVLRVISDVK